MTLTYELSLYNKHNVCLYSASLTGQNPIQLPIKINELLCGRAMERYLASVARIEIKRQGQQAIMPNVAEIEMFETVAVRNSLFAFGITRAEWLVLLQRLKGRKRKEAAADCNIEPATAKKHIENIYAKLNVHTLQEARIALLKLITCLCTFMESFALICIS